jgi:hypothetical protein
VDLNLFAKTAQHYIDPGPTFNCRMLFAGELTRIGRGHFILRFYRSAARCARASTVDRGQSTQHLEQDAAGQTSILMIG